MPRLVLASASPRRRRLLELMGLVFEIDPAHVEETAGPTEPPLAFSERLAREKAAAVMVRHHRAAVLAADTVVALGREILGKPPSPAVAHSMLRRLAGRTHEVHTAVALARDGTVVSLTDTAHVRIRPLERRLIGWYVSTGEPLDKAGAYAVQGLGGLLVQSIEGHPHTVVGLPIHRLPELFAAQGLDIFDLMEANAG